ncbi:hypothetical protein ACUJ46_08200 [Sandaracinobacteroides sp. A072]|uniref:hypothetical protein n=1 Tax=Sandaracinobacteroides sp. A072 TaxID=3461146 RepID=UPI00404141D6
MDPVTLSFTVVACITPYLIKVGEGAAEKVGEASVEAGVKMLGWMKDKLSGRAKEALEDLEKAPSQEDNQADLRKQLVKVLEANPAFADELAALLPAPADSDTQTAIASGHGAVANVVKGNNNQTFIQGGG